MNILMKLLNMDYDKTSLTRILLQPDSPADDPAVDNKMIHVLSYYFNIACPKHKIKAPKVD